jgi:hypothetical protein
MGIEAFLVLIGAAAVAASGALAGYYAHMRSTWRAPAPEVEVTKLMERLQPADVPLQVRVLRDTVAGRFGTTIQVHGVCDRLTLRRHRAAPPPPSRLSDEPTPPPPAPELEVGDEEFDRAFFVLGPPALVYALLDPPTRQALRELTAYQAPGDVVVESGRLDVFVPISQGLHPDAVERRGHEVVELARCLLTPHDVAQRLSHNAVHDPLPAVRLNILNASIREEPDNPMIRAALRAAARDQDPGIRLRAGLALGPDGIEALTSVADAANSDDADVETALAALGADVTVALADRVLRRALGRDRRAVPGLPRAARAGVLALARAGGGEAISILQALLLSNASLAEDAARALGKIGGDDAEGALIGALDGEIAEGRLAAVEVLGQMGSAAAVPALREAERRGGELRRQARQAIADIQSRLDGAPGQVSLAGGEAGQVSLAEDPGGRVSLPPGTAKGT